MSIHDLINKANSEIPKLSYTRNDTNGISPYEAFGMKPPKFKINGNTLTCIVDIPRAVRHPDEYRNLYEIPDYEKCFDKIQEIENYIHKIEVEAKKLGFEFDEHA